MNVLSFFRKSIFTGPLAFILLLSSCSQNGVTEEENVKFSTEFTFKNSQNNNLQFSLLDYYDYIQYGYLRIDGQIVRFAMDTRGGLNYNEVNKLDTNNFVVKGVNGNNLDMYVTLNQDLGSNSTNIITEIDGETYDVAIDGLVDADQVLREIGSGGFNSSSEVVPLGCPPCVVVVVAIVIGGAYCAYKQSQASDSCLAAYQSCVQSGATCSYSFQSSTCGGSCNITSSGPANLSVVAPRN
ncbi:hypothetical protein FUA48_01105 [Flavobacterium alkalisoli]|uniref:Lipoprotein n=1 Tax=Flavobacterium alkalisoli TaxID=2602769 RepID=A0A5B9FU38_9FLAO|nr:hypothetical protein [Flavobacterium alkalisoli]QEE48222.1 hypothetical protein FUA48_01105 [Flavobacterium alkalisoli]